MVEKGLKFLNYERRRQEEGRISMDQPRTMEIPSSVSRNESHWQKVKEVGKFINKELAQSPQQSASPHNQSRGKSRSESLREALDREVVFKSQSPGYSLHKLSIDRSIQKLDISNPISIEDLLSSKPGSRERQPIDSSKRHSINVISTLSIDRQEVATRDTGSGTAYLPQLVPESRKSNVVPNNFHNMKVTTTPFQRPRHSLQTQVNYSNELPYTP